MGNENAYFQQIAYCIVIVTTFYNLCYTLDGMKAFFVKIVVSIIICIQLKISSTFKAIMSTLCTGFVAKNVRRSRMKKNEKTCFLKVELFNFFNF